MRKKLGYTLCVFFAILLLSACGKQSSTEGNPMTIKDDVIQIIGKDYANDISIFLLKVREWHDEVNINEPVLEESITEDISRIGNGFYSDERYNNYIMNMDEEDKAYFDAIYPAANVYGEIAGLMLHSDISSIDDKPAFVFSSSDWDKFSESLLDAEVYYYGKSLGAEGSASLSELSDIEALNEQAEIIQADHPKYENEDVKEYFSSFSSDNEKELAYLTSCLGMTLEELVEQGIVGDQEWTAEKDYEGLFPDVGESNEIRYIKPGTLFDMPGNYVLIFWSKTEKLGCVDFAFDSADIHTIVPQLCNLCGVIEDKETYKDSVSGEFYFVVDEEPYLFAVIDRGGDTCHVEMNDTDTSKEYLQVLRDEDYDLNGETYEKAVKGYWQLRGSMKDPNSLKIKGIRENKGRIIFEYSGKNSFNATVTQYIIYEDGKLSDNYADIYYDSVDAKTVSWYTVKQYSNSERCASRPIPD